MRTQCARLRRREVIRLALVVLVAAGARARGDGLAFPPALPGGVAVVSDTSAEFIRRPADLDPGIAVATTPPRIDFLFYPVQSYPGNPWSVWGDSLAVDGKYYSAIGDHLAPAGNAFVFELDAETLALRTLSDVRSVLGLPAGHYVPGKIHGRIDRGRDGWLYFATHRGSTRVTTDEYHYEGDWILRCHPETGRSEIVAHAPIAKHCIPTSVLDPDRLLFYGGTAPGNLIDPVQFFAYDIAERRVRHTATNGPYRYLIFARSTGRVYYTHEDGGPLMRYDPASGEPPVRIAASIGLRSATTETAGGSVYSVSTRGDATLWRFDTRSEQVEKIGDAALGGEDYVASLDVDPTGRFLYWVPGAHGGGERVGSPLVQFDLRTRTKKVIAFLHPFYRDRYGYTPLGTFASAVDPRGDRVYITWNGNRGGPDRRGRVGFDTCALTVVHIPASERGGEDARDVAAATRDPFSFRDVAESTGLRASLAGAMAHAAAWGDADADGDLDLFVGTFADRPVADYVAGGANGPVPNRLLLQRDGRFELARHDDLTWRGRASGAVFVDLDGDGRDDIYVANNGRLGHENRLYRGLGDGRFDDITTQVGAPLAEPDTARSATVLDFDGDGRLDVLVLSTAGKGATRLFRNAGSAASGPRFEVSDAIPGDACGLGVVAGDLTGNGWPDVLIGGPNRLEASLAVEHTREDDSPSCGVAFGDVNRDGRLDIVVGTHRKSPWRDPVPIRLWINRGSTPESARFEDVTAEAGLVPLAMKAPHVEIRDFDNDGWPDLYTSIVVHGDGAQSGAVWPAIFRNLGAEPGGLPRFEETAFVHRAKFPEADDLGSGGRSSDFYERLVARRRVMYFAPGPSADFDGDGRLDLFLASWFPKYPSLLLRNETAGGGFVDVEVAGGDGVNACGIGAVARAYLAGGAGDAAALIASEPIATAYGYCSGQPPVAHLGLGDATSCDVVVVLPHGKGEIVRRAVGAGTRLRVAAN